MSLNTEDSLILCIDIQEKLLNAACHKDIVSKNSKIISQAAEILEIPMIITEQYPKGLGKTIEGINSEHVFEKKDFNCGANQELISLIKSMKIKNILLMGIETHICVWQSAIFFKESGYDVTVISNASSSRNEFEHESAIQCFINNGINVKTTEMVLFELLKTANHPQFKSVQALIK